MLALTLHLFVVPLQILNLHILYFELLNGMVVLQVGTRCLDPILFLLSDKLVFDFGQFVVFSLVAGHFVGHFLMLVQQLDDSLTRQMFFILFPFVLFLALHPLGQLLQNLAPILLPLLLKHLQRLLFQFVLRHLLFLPAEHILRLCQNVVDSLCRVHSLLLLFLQRFIGLTQLLL